MAAAIDQAMFKKTFPLPAAIAGLAALVALPFSLAAAMTLFLAAGLGAIIHADYTLRCRPAPLPRRRRRETPARFRRFAAARETHRLAA